MAVVLVIGDTHCPGMRPDYIPFLKQIYRKYKCNRVVHIGDLVDNAPMSFHKQSKKMPGGSDELGKARAQVRLLTKAFPEVDLLLGNHDALADRQALDAGFQPEFIKSFHEQYDLPRGWRVHEQFEYFNIDGVNYCHGDRGSGQYAALSLAINEATSTVAGHFHAQAYMRYHPSERYRWFGMGVGCGIDINADRGQRFKYAKGYKLKPMLSCGVVVKSRLGVRAYLEPMLLSCA